MVAKVIIVRVIGVEEIFLPMGIVKERALLWGQYLYCIGYGS